MSADSKNHNFNFPQNSSRGNSTASAKQPRSLLEDIFAFAPNRETLGGTSYLIVKNDGNILLDCPAWNENNQQFLHSRGGVRWLVISHRGGIGKQVARMQSALQCDILIQEQEAYLLPEVEVRTFSQEFSIGTDCFLLWTPGYSPGSSCLYWQKHQGVLFSGRHLLPIPSGEITPLRMTKTFHWFRQLNSIQLLRDRFSPQTLNYIFPGANTGFLRGKGYIEDAYDKLASLDLAKLRFVKPSRNFL